MSQYNQAVCIRNIYKYAKSRYNGIMNLENKLGVSQGYFSRLLKKGEEEEALLAKGQEVADPGPSLGIRLLSRLADEMGISIDTLISVDLEKLDLAEQRMVAFIDSLVRETNDFGMRWTLHQSPMSDDDQLFFKEGKYQSAFDSEADMAEGMYFSKFGENAVAYLIPVYIPEMKIFRSMMTEKEEFELYVVMNGEVSSICSSDDKRYAVIMDNLITAVMEHSERKTIKEPIMEEINNFINASKNRK